MTDVDTTCGSQYEKLLATPEQLIALLEERDREIEKLQTHILNVNRKTFGKKSEKFVSDQQEGLFTFEEKPAGDDATETINVEGHERKIKRGRKPLPADLPRRREEHFPEQEFCECCGSKLEKIGEEKTEEIEYVPSKLEVVEHIKIKCACPKCQGAGVKTGKIPEGTLPLPGSRPGASLIAHIIISKYLDHQPLHRLEQILLRDGLELSRRRMCDWITAVVDQGMTRLWKALKAEVLALSYVQADETHIKVRDLERLETKKELFTGYFWAVHGPPNLAFFEYHDTRASEAALEVLKDYRGVVQTDFYAGYNPVLLPEKAKRIACMAHIRRRFIEARPVAPSQCDAIIRQIRKLYDFEKAWKDLEPEERLQNRQNKARPVFDKLYEMLQSLSDRMLPKHALQEALKYALKQRTEMERYLEDGNFKIDNNPVEREIRPIALGRKNYLFAGSHEGARRAAVLYSLLAICKLNKINPKEWLTDVLRRLPCHPVNRIAELLPHRWKPLPKPGDTINK